MAKAGAYKAEQLRAAHDASAMLSPAAVGSLMRMQANLFDAWMKCNIEVLDFLKNRFEEDRKLAAHMGESADPAAALNVYAEFWRKAMSDYAGEADKLTKMNTEIAARASGGGEPPQ